MTGQSIHDLLGRHKGETIYVVGSGASLDYIGRDFFYGRIVVAVNEVFRHVPAMYVVSHHHENGQEAIDAGFRLIASDLDLGGGDRWGKRANFIGDYSVYRGGTYQISLNPTIDAAALRKPFDDHLVVSCCSSSEALQFAGHLGAETIIACGLDGAALDGQTCVKGYNGGAQTNPQHLRLTQGIIRETVTALREKGINVFSLSPFVGADLEGHVFTSAPVLDGRPLIDALGTTNWQVTR